MSLSSDVNANASGAEAFDFVLPAIMGIETVEALADELNQLPIAGKKSLVLDASNVESVTTPSLQLIISFEKKLEAQGCVLVINGQKDSFLLALDSLGLRGLLDKKL